MYCGLRLEPYLAQARREFLAGKITSRRSLCSDRAISLCDRVKCEPRIDSPDFRNQIEIVAAG